MPFEEVSNKMNSCNLTMECKCSTKPELKDPLEVFKVVYTSNWLPGVYNKYSLVHKIIAIKIFSRFGTETGLYVKTVSQQRV